MKKLLSVAIGSALLGGGAVFGATDDTAQVTALKSEKAAILQDNVWKDVRLGIPPEYNTSTTTNISVEEMIAAYVAVANEKNAKQTFDLYANLREKAEAEGVTCKI